MMSRVLPSQKAAALRNSPDDLRIVQRVCDSFRGEQEFKSFSRERRLVLLLCGTDAQRQVLQTWHRERTELDAKRAEARFDLGASMDDLVRGGEWERPLRLIARFHVMYDVHAPLLFRVNREFEYCWRLAVSTTATDLRAARANPLDCTLGPGSAEYSHRWAVLKQRRAKREDHIYAQFAVRALSVRQAGESASVDAKMASSLVSRRAVAVPVARAL